MKEFWREYWPWICVPVVVVVVFFVVLAVVLGSGDDTSPFIYNIF